jgi:glycosyltransferase involved in cell wall biosynthesis
VKPSAPVIEEAGAAGDGRVPGLRAPERRLLFPIVHVLPARGIGGVEIAVRSAAIENPDIRPLYIDDSPAAPEAVQFRRIGASIAWTIRTVLAFDALRRLRNRRRSVAVFSLWKASLAFLVWRLAWRRPALLFIHCSVPVHWVDRGLTRLCAHLADGVLADSTETAEKRCPAQLERGRVRVVSLLLDRLAPGDNAARDPGAFIYWGRYSTQKRIDRALSLFAAVREFMPEATLQMFGPDNGQMQRVRDRVVELGLQDAVSVGGPRPREEIFERARTATYFLQTSDYEGFCMSVAEAMQLGVIPVVTAVGEIANYCRHDENALIISSTDATIADLRRVHADRLLREALARRAVATWAGRPTYAEDFQAQVVDLLATSCSPRAHSAFAHYGAPRA